MKLLSTALTMRVAVIMLLASFVNPLVAQIATQPDWQPVADFDGQLFPSFIIATATMRPPPATEPVNSALLGDPFGLFGITLRAPADKSRIKVTIQANALMEASVFQGVMEKSGQLYVINPKINYKYDQLRRVRQQIPLNLVFAVEINGQPAGVGSETLTVRSINDCPYGLAEASDSTNAAAPSHHARRSVRETSKLVYADLGWMFGAYVNENHPWLDRLLKESLDSGVVDSFDGYQSADEDQVLLQMFSVWNLLELKGIKYSNTTLTPGDSRTVYSQYVRFLDESTVHTQANCVDACVMLASMFRKIELDSFLVLIPGHMYVGVYLDPEQKHFVALETTVLGTDEAGDDPAIHSLRERLPAGIRQGDSFRTFSAAIADGTQDVKANWHKIELGTDPDYQIIDIAQIRQAGIMPIPYYPAD